MNKRDFVKMFAKRVVCNDDEAALVIESFLKAIVEVTANDSLYLVGFGEFKRHQRKSKEEGIDYPAELKFKASVDLPEIYWQEWDAQKEQPPVQGDVMPEQSGGPIDIALDLALEGNGDSRE